MAFIEFYRTLFPEDKYKLTFSRMYNFYGYEKKKLLMMLLEFHFGELNMEIIK